MKKLISLLVLLSALACKTTSREAEAPREPNKAMLLTEPNASYLDFGKGAGDYNAVISCAGEDCDVDVTPGRRLRLSAIDDKTTSIEAYSCSKEKHCVKRGDFTFTPAQSEDSTPSHPLPTLERHSYRLELGTIYRKLQGVRSNLASCNLPATSLTPEQTSAINQLDTFLEGGEGDFVENNLPRLLTPPPTDIPQGLGLAGSGAGGAKRFSLQPTPEFPIRVDVGYQIERKTYRLLDALGDKKTFRTYMKRLKGSGSSAEFLFFSMTDPNLTSAHALIRISEQDKLIDYISWGRKDSLAEDAKRKKGDEVVRSFYISEQTFVDFHFWKLKTHVWYYKNSVIDGAFERVRVLRDQVLKTIFTDPRFAGAVNDYLVRDGVSNLPTLRDQKVAAAGKVDHRTYDAETFTTAISNLDKFKNAVNKTMANGSFLEKGPFDLEQLTPESREKVTALFGEYRNAYAEFKRVNRPLTEAEKATARSEEKGLYDDLRAAVGKTNDWEFRKWLAYNHRALLAGDPLPDVGNLAVVRERYQKFLVNQVDQSELRQRYYANWTIFGFKGQSCVDIASVCTRQLMQDDDFYGMTVKRTPRGLVQELDAKLELEPKGFPTKRVVGGVIGSSLVGAGMVVGYHFLAEGISAGTSAQLNLATSSGRATCVQQALQEANRQYLDMANLEAEVLRYQLNGDFFEAFLPAP